MQQIHSSVTDLPLSCKSAAEHMAHELEKEDRYASLDSSCQQKLTKLEQELSANLGEKIALVAYRI